MRRTTQLLIALAVIAVPTAAHAAGTLLDPDGESVTITVLEPWVDSLLSVLLTYLGA